MTTYDPASGRGAAAAGAVVVGVDGSAGSLAALRWAVSEAAAHAAPVWVIHVLDPRGHRAPYAQAGTLSFGSMDQIEQAERLIDQAVREAHAPDSVRRQFEIGSPADVLLNTSRAARMLVVGHTPPRHRAADGLAPEDRALGPVARACAARASCPVVVVPAPAPRSAVPAPRETDAAAPRRVPVEGVRTLYPRYQARPVHR
ncbi:MAG TPA: universal stress protein [Thermoleophilia bacterium]|jgi:nucleotide-binding universal stress UspA family protein|nr:universal stress protein [Thermoleophilia bacterium]